MSRASHWQRARAAQAIREGKTHVEAARVAGVHVRTVFNWVKEPGFLDLVAGRGVITLGAVEIRTAAENVLADVAVEESWVWIGGGEVLGSLLVDEARHLRAVFVSTAERVEAVREALGQQRFPGLEGEATTVLVPAALAVLQDDPDALELLVRICTAPPAEAFRAFLSVWRFRAQETKDVRLLGNGLWPAQGMFIREIVEHPHVYALKARKLGQTTIACAFDAYVLRFRDQNARVHLFSHVEKAALELLEQVRFGLDRLPEFLRLPASRRTAHEFELDAGAHDRRLAVTYATSERMAIESTSTHSHIDEWADMPRPDRIYQSLEPTFTAPGCTSLIITTGAGPANPAADYWRRCLDGDGLHHPIFIPATARPDRDQAWLEHKRRTLPADAFTTEYACTWEEALAGGGARVFTCAEIDAAMSDPRPLLSRAEPGRKYVIGVDIGSRHDHTVITVLDVTEERIDVAAYLRLQGNYPQLQKAIIDMHQAFRPAFSAIEANSGGAAVCDNLALPEHELRRFTTSKTSKARIIENLRLHLQQQSLKFHPALTQLEAELRDYQLPDDNVIQDSVISLAIALEHAPEARAHQSGRINSRLFRALNPPPSSRQPISTGLITWTPAN
jgi:hypothetical protein